jgi:N-dimethylarginine dimethylaminohydrolase
VIELEPLEGTYTKSMYVRDPFVAVPGGVVVTRLAPVMRRGEEAAVTRELAAHGLPILATIVGDGLVEGGSLVRVSPTDALYGTGVRCNEAGAEQLAAVLARLGVTLHVVPQSGSALHLDGALAMVGADKAVLIPDRVPWWVPDLLGRLGVETIAPDPAEPWAVNLLAVAPGRVVLSTSAPRSAERLRRRGVDVLEVPFDHIERNGGGVHCSTNELIREEVGR